MANKTRECTGGGSTATSVGGDAGARREKRDGQFSRMKDADGATAPETAGRPPGFPNVKTGQHMGTGGQAYRMEGDGNGGSGDGNGGSGDGNGSSGDGSVKSDIFPEGVFGGIKEEDVKATCYERREHEKNAANAMLASAAIAAIQRSGIKGGYTHDILEKFNVIKQLLEVVKKVGEPSNLHQLLMINDVLLDSDLGSSKNAEINKEITDAMGSIAKRSPKGSFRQLAVIDLDRTSANKLVALFDAIAVAAPHVQRDWPEYINFLQKLNEISENPKLFKDHRTLDAYTRLIEALAGVK